MPAYSGASYTCKWPFLWPGCWKEVPNPLPIGIRTVSLLFPQTSSRLMDNSNSLTLSRKLGIGWALTFSPTGFYSSHNYRAVSPVTERNLLSLIPRWARPVRAPFWFCPHRKVKILLKCDIPVVLQCEFKTPWTCSNPLTCAAGWIVKPEFWTVQFPGLHFIVRKGMIWERHLWERSPEPWDDVNTSEAKV